MAYFLGTLAAYLLDPIYWGAVIIGALLFKNQSYLMRAVIASGFGFVVGVAFVAMMDLAFNLARIIAPIVMSLIVCVFIKPAAKAIDEE